MTLDTAAITARLAAATPGAWVAIAEPGYWHVDRYGGPCVADELTAADAALIAAAPADLAALLAEVARLTRAIRGTHDYCDTTRRIHDAHCLLYELDDAALATPPSRRSQRPLLPRLRLRK